MMNYPHIYNKYSGAWLITATHRLCLKGDGQKWKRRNSRNMIPLTYTKGTKEKYAGVLSDFRRSVWTAL